MQEKLSRLKHNTSNIGLRIIMNKTEVKYRVTTDGGAEEEDITARLAFIDLQYILVYQHK